MNVSNGPKQSLTIINCGRSTFGFKGTAPVDRAALWNEFYALGDIMGPHIPSVFAILIWRLALRAEPDLEIVEAQRPQSHRWCMPFSLE